MSRKRCRAKWAERPKKSGSPKPKQREVTYYFCLLLDMLNQGEKLCALKDMDLVTQKDEIGERLRDVWGVIHKLRESFEIMRREVIRPREPIFQQMPKELWKQASNFQFHTGTSEESL